VNILVFNCGSSSLKYRLIAMPGERELAGGEAQRVGPPTAEPARIVHRSGGAEEKIFVDMPSHAAAFGEVMKLLGPSGDLRPDAVGHRMVHGGSRFRAHALVGDDTLPALEEINELAPLHNPPQTALVAECRRRFPELPQVLVFDTAYHATIPARARTYALPADLSASLGLYKHGFHGTSHAYVVSEAARFLGRRLEAFNAVSCHLGSGGASLCAVAGGRSIDNTMGYSPLQGLVMSTRCGDLDPALTLRLLARPGGGLAAVEGLLNRQSGVLGMSGSSADIRDVLAARTRTGEADSRAETAAQVYLWRLRKYLGAYLAVVGSADAVIFTDTIGETVPQVRLAACAGMEAFGLEIDPEKNANVKAYPADVATDGSLVRILVILTNEELAIARSVHGMLSGAGPEERKESAA
jgi:acetate kinase